MLPAVGPNAPNEEFLIMLFDIVVFIGISICNAVNSIRVKLFLSITELTIFMFPLLKLCENVIKPKPDIVPPKVESENELSCINKSVNWKFWKNMEIFPMFTNELFVIVNLLMYDKFVLPPPPPTNEFENMLFLMVVFVRLNPTTHPPAMNVFPSIKLS